MFDVCKLQQQCFENAMGPTWKSTKIMPKEAAQSRSRQFPGLLTDLKSRGMLEDTPWRYGRGEFRRTPTVQETKFDGRDPHPHGFTIRMAGAGVKAGFRY